MSRDQVMEELVAAQRAVDGAYAERRSVVLRARDAGVSVAEIAEVLGLSRQRVYQILKNSR